MLVLVARENSPTRVNGGIINTSTIVRTPLKTRRFAVAMIESTKQARNNGAEMMSSAGETKSRMRSKIRQRNDQKEGFQSFLLEATGVGGGPSMQAPFFGTQPDSKKL
jgi:hypothetical protein